MKLGKLLAAGKNILAMGGEAGYHVSKNPLPKFSPAKNPFNTTTKLDAPKAEAQSQNLVAAKTQKMPVISGSAKSLAAWTTKLNPMTALRGPAEDSKNLQPIQAELSLEKVKVVHNDLSDADVEVVPIKSRSLPGVPELQPAKKSWEILGERLMRATVL